MNKIRPYITWVNLIKLVFVLPVRVPILVMLYILIQVGNIAEWGFEVISTFLPGLSRGPEYDQQNEVNKDRNHQ